jgi:hypothetical protein
MSTFKKVLAVLVIFIAALGILINAAGIILAWSVNTPVTEAIVGPLTQIQNANRQLSELVDQGGSVTSQVVDRLSQVQAAATQLQANFETGTPLLDLVSNLTGVDLNAKLEQAYSTLAAIQDGVTSLNASIQTFDALPFVNIPRIAEGTQEIEALLDQLVNGIDTLRQQANSLKEQASQQLIQPVLDTIGGITDTFANLQSRLQQVQTQMAAADAALTNLIVRIPGMIDWLSIIITVLMLWLAFAQAGLIYLALVFYRNGHLRFSADQGAAPALMEGQPEDSTPSTQE